MREHYFIDPKKGIYYTEKTYRDDIDYIYVVDFEKPDVEKQFQTWQATVRDDGKKEGMQELKRQFKGLRELLS